MQQQGKKRNAEESEQDSESQGISKKIKRDHELGSPGEKVEWTSEDELETFAGTAQTSSTSVGATKSKSESKDEKPSMLDHPNQEHYANAAESYEQEQERKNKEILKCVDCGKSLGVTYDAWFDLSRKEGEKFLRLCSGEDCETEQYLCLECFPPAMEKRACKACREIYQKKGGNCLECCEKVKPGDICNQCGRPWCCKPDDWEVTEPCNECLTECEECNALYNRWFHPGKVCPDCDEMHNELTCKGCMHQDLRCEKDCAWCK